MDRCVMEKREKKRFVILTRILLKYLETKDPILHSNVKSIIKDCAERKHRKEVGYESSVAMRFELIKVVPDVYWRKAEKYLDRYWKKQTASGPDIEESEDILTILNDFGDLSIHINDTDPMSTDQTESEAAT